jgi:hypothetical protein
MTGAQVTLAVTLPRLTDASVEPNLPIGVVSLLEKEHFGGRRTGVCDIGGYGGGAGKVGAKGGGTRGGVCRSERRKTGLFSGRTFWRKEGRRL